MHYKSNQYLKYIIIGMCIGGLWPLKFKNKVLAFIYSSYLKVILVCFCTFVLTQYVQFYVAFQSGISDVTELITVVNLYTMNIVKIYLLNSSSFTELIDYIYNTEKVILASGKSITKLYKQNMARCNVSCYLFFMFGSVCCFQFCLTPPLISFISKKANITLVDKPLLFQSWFPFDSNEHYLIAYGWQVFNGILGSMFSVSTDNFLFGLTIYPTGQLKILQKLIVNIKLCSDEKCNNEKCNVNKRLVECVVHHIRIIRFVKKFNNCIRVFILLDFIATAIQITSIIFEVIVAGMGFMVFKELMYLFGMTTRLCLFYWHANEIALESLNVAKALWYCNWESFEVKNQKIVAMMMMRAQCPLTLSIGKFYKMTNDIIIRVLQSSFSYAMVIRQFYVNK